jgi:biotin carboxyl carrier protein
MRPKSQKALPSGWRDVDVSGQPLVVLEAMKMEHTVTAPADEVVADIRAKAGDPVTAGQILAVMEAAA